MDDKDKRMKTLSAIVEIANILRENDLTIVYRTFGDLFHIGFIEDRMHVPEGIEKSIVAELDCQSIMDGIAEQLRDLKRLKENRDD